MSSAMRGSGYGVNGSSQDKSAPRPRMTAQNSFKSERSESKRSAHGPSPQPIPSMTSHKRTASGNPRPASRAVDERRTERVQVTTKESLVSRTRSPERRGAPSEKSRTFDVPKQRPAEAARPKEAKMEPPFSGNLRFDFQSPPLLLHCPPRTGLLLTGTMNNMYSPLGTRGYPAATYLCALGVAYIGAASGLLRPADITAEAPPRAAACRPRSRHGRRPSVRLYGL